MTIFIVVFVVLMSLIAMFTVAFALAYSPMEKDVHLKLDKLYETEMSYDRVEANGFIPVEQYYAEEQSIKFP